MGAYFTDFTAGFPLTEDAFNTRLWQLGHSLQEFKTGVRAWGQINIGTGLPKLTIADDTITISKSFHTIDTEGAAASDNLSTVEGGFAGDIITLSITSSARVITLKHNVGNLYLGQGLDIVLSDSLKSIRLLFNGNYWMDVGWGSSLGAGKRLIVPRTVLTVNTVTITIPIIPQYYNHLELLVECQLFSSTAFRLRCNGDAVSGNYVDLTATIQNSVPHALTLVGSANTGFLLLAPGSATPFYDPFSVTFFNYTDISRQRFMYGKSLLQTSDVTNGKQPLMMGGRWVNTADTITSLELVASDHFMPGTAYTLYGIV